MEKKSTLGGQNPTGVNGLTTSDLSETPMNESPCAFAGPMDVAEVVTPPLHSIDGLPARRIQLRYWVAMLALGLAIWAAIFIWLI